MTDKPSGAAELTDKMLEIAAGGSDEQKKQLLHISNA